MTREEQMREASYEFGAKFGNKGKDPMMTEIAALWFRRGAKWADENPENHNNKDCITEFEKELKDICIGWIGEEVGWEDYIKSNANRLLEIAKTLNK